MSPDRRAANRLCLAAAAAIALAAVPIGNFDNTMRVVETLLTNKTSCTDGTRPFDAMD